MRYLLLKLFISAVLLGIVWDASAQTCSGSLGDPVIYQTFGSGTNPGPALGSGVTNLSYTTNNCPDDGYYTIVNSINTNPSNCHTTWQSVASDHTGNPNGYMMVVNASYQPSIFFTQTANGLCPNTTYEFSAYILNLITLAASQVGNVSEPNITFSIETVDGTVLKTYNTGTIDPTDAPKWTKYGTYFATPDGVTDVIVKMTNNAPGGNGNDLVLDDIAFRACGPIVQTGFGSLAANGSQDICEGSNINYTLTSSVGAGYNNPSMQWQSNANNGGWTNIAGATSPNYTINIPQASAGTYQYRLAVGEGTNINTLSCFVNSDPLTINVNPLPVATLPAVQTACIGDVLTLTASGGSTYTWTGPNMSPSNQNPLTINITQQSAGTYTVVPTSDKGCVGPPAQTEVKVEPKIVALVSSNVSICAGNSTQLKASGGLYYQWTPSIGLDHNDIADPVASPAQTTTYSVKVSNDGCYDDTKSVTVTVNMNPVANAGDGKVIFSGQSTTLNGSVSGDNVTNFYWSPADYLNDPYSLTPIASPPHDMTYILHVSSSTCGQSAGSVFVRVYQKITIPNAFTPNGDGINDYWNIDALITYPQSLTTVYTRDGQQVFKSVGYAKPWDGTTNGKQLPTGTYYYVIDLKDGQPPFSGWVLIER